MESKMSDNVCRDFMRSICRRGKYCKFVHPPVEEVQRKYVFCIDFRNGKCSRNGCRFIHCSREEEEFYIQIGNMTPEVLRMIEMTGTPEPGNVPICKCYLKDNCRLSQTLVNSVL